MINSSTIVGRLTRDPDLRYSQAGKAVCNFTLATNRPFKNAQGENEADFIKCLTFGKQAENLANYMRKGSLVGVEGRIQTRSYTNKDGNKVYTTEVVANQVSFLDNKKDNQQQKPQNNQSQMEPIDIDDSQLPF
jgi:single-strand DNA-binding protein